MNEYRQNRCFTSGKFFLTPANLDHAAILDDGSEFLVLDLEPDFVARSIYELVDPERVELVPNIADSDPFVDQIGLTLKAELIKSGLASRLYIESLFTALSIHLLRHHSTYGLIPRQYSDGLPLRRLQRAIDFIHANLDQKLTLEAIAQQLHMSVYYFCDLFTQSIGVPPYRYVLQQRVERAKQLLKNRRELSLTQVALECGFANQSHFTRHFRKLTGMTPKYYRGKV